MEEKKRLAIREDKINYDDEVADEKIETFFALIRNTREARDRLVSRRRRKLRKLKEEKLVVVLEEKAKNNWIPAFKWEDFMNDKKSILFGGSSTTTTKNRDHNDDEIKLEDERNEEREVVGLIDLNLKL